MLLIYTPTGGDRQEIIFKPAKLWSVEAEAIEEVGGTAWSTFEQFGETFLRGNRRAYRAALWIMLRREQPKLKFAELALQVDELTVDLDQDERNAVLAAVEDNDEITDDERTEVLATLKEPVGKDEPGDDSTDSP